MKTCKRCVLPGNFPGLAFSNDGLCSECVSYNTISVASQKQERKRCLEKFVEIIKDTKASGDYDCALSYSGGKDSSYTLYLLRRVFKLRVLALTFDNGFIPEQTFANIRAVTESLGADSLIIKPRFDMLSKIFVHAARHSLFSQKSLERASSICTACIGIVKFSFMRIAIEKNIHILAWGWSPGQAPLRSSIIKMNPSFMMAAQNALTGPLIKIAGKEVMRYFLTGEHCGKNNNIPYLVSPLAFMRYDEKKIRRTIDSFGWRAPKGVDANSTNCYLNSYANSVHLNRYRFHPYALELACLVREGVMSRTEALNRLSAYGDARTIRGVKQKLGIKR